MTVRGIDVASYQATGYSTSGLDFVFIKATEGTSYTSGKMAAQLATARKAGLAVGFYHFARPGDTASEADYFLAKTGALHPGDMLVLDWEDTGVTSAQKDAWIRYVQGKRPGHRVLLYCNLDFWKTRDQSSFAGDGLWIADPGVIAGHPRVQHPWTFHQYSSAGGTDRNVGDFADQAALLAWTGAAIKPPPAPAARPKVSLAHIIAAAKHDPIAAQGHTTHKAEVLIVEKALKAEGLLASQYVDGSFGTKTVAAYARWQRSPAGGGYVGAAADGIPGKASLTHLAARHGFTVTP